MKETQNSALPEAQGLLKNLRNNLSGKDGFIWLAALKLFIRREPTWASPNSWPVWKTIKTGIHKSFASFEEDCKRLNIQMGEEDLYKAIKKLKFKNLQEHDIKLVEVNIMDLGFSKYETATYQQIIKKAKKKGLKLCTLFDALALRTSYIDTEKTGSESYDERKIILFSNPIDYGIIGKGRLLYIFGFKNEEEPSLWLCWTQPLMMEHFNKDSRLIFRIE